MMSKKTAWIIIIIAIVFLVTSLILNISASDTPAFSTPVEDEIGEGNPAGQIQLEIAPQSSNAT